MLSLFLFAEGLFAQAVTSIIISHPRCLMPFKLKRPCAAATAIEQVPMKKPARWEDFAQSQQEGGSCDEADCSDELDSRPVTPQQRHVFKKALEALPGLPGSLPAPVQEAWEQAAKGRPGDRAAIINATVPRDVSYKDTFKTSDLDLKRFTKVFRKAESSHKAEGIGRTEMEAMWGHGDQARGEQLVELALSRGELFLKNNLSYKRSHQVTVTKGQESGVEGSAVGSADDYGNFTKDEAMDEWAQFALETPKGSQQLAIENKKPPTDKALSYLSKAKSKVDAAIEPIKASGKGFAKLTLPPHQRTHSELLKKALLLSKQTQNEYLGRIDDLVSINSDTVSDQDVKRHLNSLRPTYEELSSIWPSASGTRTPA